MKIDKWAEKVKKYLANKEFLGFSAKCIKNDNQIQVILSNLDNKFAIPIQYLTEDIVNGAIEMLDRILTAEYTFTKEDYTRESLYYQQLIDEQIEYYINLLLDGKPADMMKLIMAERKLSETKYTMNNMQSEGDIWTFPDGSYVGLDGIVRTEDHQYILDDTLMTISAIMGISPKVA